MNTSVLLYFKKVEESREETKSHVQKQIPHKDGRGQRTNVTNENWLEKKNKNGTQVETQFSWCIIGLADDFSFVDEICLFRDFLGGLRTLVTFICIILSARQRRDNNISSASPSTRSSYTLFAQNTCINFFMSTVSQIHDLSPILLPRGLLHRRGSTSLLDYATSNETSGFSNKRQSSEAAEVHRTKNRCGHKKLNKNMNNNNRKFRQDKKWHIIWLKDFENWISHKMYKERELAKMRKTENERLFCACPVVIKCWTINRDKWCR